MFVQMFVFNQTSGWTGWCIGDTAGYFGFTSVPWDEVEARCSSLLRSAVQTWEWYRFSHLTTKQINKFPKVSGLKPQTFAYQVSGCLGFPLVHCQQNNIVEYHLITILAFFQLLLIKLEHTGICNVSFLMDCWYPNSKMSKYSNRQASSKTL